MIILWIVEMRDSGGRGGHTIADMHDQSLRPYSGYGVLDAGTESVVAMGARHDASFYTDYHTAYHGHHLDSSAVVLPTYTNFFNTSCMDQQQQQHEQLKHEPGVAASTEYMTSHGENHHYAGEAQRYSSTLVPPPLAIPMSHDVFSTTTASESINRDHDMESLRRELAYKCPRSSDLLMAITSTADATVREHGSATSGVSSDDDDAPDELARPSSTPCQTRNNHLLGRLLD